MPGREQAVVLVTAAAMTDRDTQTPDSGSPDLVAEGVVAEDSDYDIVSVRPGRQAVSVIAHSLPGKTMKEAIMKLAISMSGNSIDSPFDARFGRAAAFCIIDTESGDWRAHENPALSASGGAGVQAAQFVAHCGAQAVVSGAYGPNAYNTFLAAEIEMYVTPTDRPAAASQIFAMFKSGELTRVTGATIEGHHEVHHGGRRSW